MFIDSQLVLWMSRIIIILLIVYSLMPSAFNQDEDSTMRTRRPTHQPPPDHGGGGGGSGNGMKCISCQQCETGVFIKICQANEICYSKGEISKYKNVIRFLGIIVFNNFLYPDRFDNKTEKGCTGNGADYCSVNTPDSPCYTCDWDLCNPLLFAPFGRGGSNSLAFVGQWNVSKLIVVGLFMFIKSKSVFVYMDNDRTQ